MTQSRFWIGTSYRENFELPKEIEYGVFQTERCPTTQKLHKQWFVVFSKRMRFNQVKTLFPEDHLEVAKNPVKAREYCMKTETRVSTPVEVGSVGAWAKQVQKANVVNLLKQKRVIEVLEAYPDMWRSTRQLRDLRSEFQPQRDHLTQGILFTGTSGTGKTKCAALISKFVGDTYWKNGSKWWNGYDGEPLVIWDEFRGNENLYISDLLRLLDRTPYQAEYKGGVTHFVANTIIFCSNKDLNSMYILDDKTQKALERRFLTITFK